MFVFSFVVPFFFFDIILFANKPTEIVMTNRNISTREFAVFGLSLINRKSNSKPTFDRLFHDAGDPLKMSEIELYQSYFGILPKVCRFIWILLRRNELIPEHGLPIHLLWALMFMKLYLPEKVLASIAGCTVKTYTKWTWKFIRRIAFLKTIVVRIFLYFMMTISLLSS